MRKVDNLLVGWLQTGLRNLVDNGVRLLNEMPFALITSIDSAVPSSSWTTCRPIVENYRGCKLLGHGMIVPQGLLFEINKEFDLFHGFDEMWFFDVEPILQKPDDVWLVGPTNLDLEELAPSLVRWMGKSACKLGLGDGAGLNFVTPNEDIAKEIERGSK